jgi:hypothetical protein
MNKDNTMCSQSHFAWPTFLGGLYGLLLTGCASSLSDDIKIPMGELALHDAAPKAESIAKLERHISEAKSDNMPFLAPHYFREATEMVETLKRTSPGNVSALDLAKADAVLDRGETVSSKVRSRFSRELDLKANLERSKADEIYPWRYKMIIYDFSKLIEKVELNKAGNIDNDKEQLNQSMQELYNKTVLYTSSHGNPIAGKGAEELVDKK